MNFSPFDGFDSRWFQSAMNALNPVATIREQLDDTFDAHRERVSGMAELIRPLWSWWVSPLSAIPP